MRPVIIYFTQELDILDMSIVNLNLETKESNNDKDQGII